MRLLDFVDVPGEICPHFVDGAVRNREIVLRIILPFRGAAHPLHVELQTALERRDISRHLDIIQIIKISDARIPGIPDFGVERPRLILQCEAVIRLARLGSEFLLLLAQIDVADGIALPQICYKMHSSCSFVCCDIPVRRVCRAPARIAPAAALRGTSGIPVPGVPGAPSVIFLRSVPSGSPPDIVPLDSARRKLFKHLIRNFHAPGQIPFQVLTKIKIQTIFLYSNHFFCRPT